MKQVIKNQKLFFISLLGIVVVSLIMGTTYAYQTLQVEYKEGSISNLGGDNGIQTPKLEVNFNVTCKEGKICDENNDNYNRINLTNMPLLPDYKTADYTEFTLTNNSTSNVGYKIDLINITYSSNLVSSDFKYTITEIVDGREYVKYRGDFSNLSSTSFNVVPYTYFEKNTTKTLRIYLWLKETELDQNGLENTSFQSTIEVNSMFNTDITEKLVTNFDLIGNTRIKQAKPTTTEQSPVDPATLYTLGNLVTDELNPNYNKYEIPIKLIGDNYLNLEHFSDISSWKNCGATGTGYANYPLELPPGTYTFKFDTDLTTFNNTIFVLSKYPSTPTNPISTIVSGKYEVVDKIKTFTVEKGENLYFNWFYSNTKGGENQANLNIVINELLNNFMIVKGSYTKTTFPEYKAYESIEYKMYLDEPLRSVGDYSDYIDFDNNLLYRNIKKVSFNGTENWNDAHDALTNTYRVSIPLDEVITNVNDIPVVSNIFIKGNESDDTNNIRISDNNLYVRVLKEYLSASDISSFKSWVSDNNFDVYYPMITDIYGKDIELPYIENLGLYNLVVCANEVCANTDVLFDK